ncbi:thiamine-binding protein [Mechercharimyces sp. CAU 1602]|uniref:thiamine-binding protein n=1 Tax=Mechercharimyces sp. CAU 1602 TaxID=2973933 RepID=UPI0021626869|nr:thiamine-binding protein [Mechercharimyces sp. CAU 1602]MCS1352335.1 thiamine-binding protein [Mechercharimyces sp. CAU 1602]
MANAHVSVQILPRGHSTDEIYRLVDVAIDVIAKSGVPYIVGPMETTMEGELDELMQIAKEAQEAVIAAGSERVVSMIKVDYSPQGISFQEKLYQYKQEALK